MHDIPANVTLNRDEQGKKRKQIWNYYSIICMISYLVNSTRLDILFAVHQCTRFLLNPKWSHEEVVKHISRYLKRIKQKGIIYKFNATKGIEVFVDADFAGT